MAELVDALVSNTNGAIRAGSIPARGTEKRKESILPLFVFCTVLDEWLANDHLSCAVGLSHDVDAWLNRLFNKCAAQGVIAD